MRAPGARAPAAAPAALQRFLRWWGHVDVLITLGVFGHLSGEFENASELYPASVLQLVDEIDALAARHMLPRSRLECIFERS